MDATIEMDDAEAKELLYRAALAKMSTEQADEILNDMLPQRLMTQAELAKEVLHVSPGNTRAIEGYIYQPGFPHVVQKGRGEGKRNTWKYYRPAVQKWLREHQEEA